MLLKLYLLPSLIRSEQFKWFGCNSGLCHFNDGARSNFYIVVYPAFNALDSINIGCYNYGLSVYILSIQSLELCK
jgi:hypothetical protein